MTIRIFRKTAFPGPGAQVSYNAAAAEIYGVEGDIDIAVNKNLTISAGFAAIHSKITRFNGLGPTNSESGAALRINPTGNPLPFAAPFVGNISATYRLPTSIGEFSASTTYNYNDGYASDISNRRTARFPSYELLSANLGWTSQDGRYSASLWGKNLLGSYYYATITPIFLGDLLVPADPRTYGVTLQVNF